MSDIIHIQSITESHRLMGLQPPKHPLISVIDLKDLYGLEYGGERFNSDLYMVSLKDGASGSIGYGRVSYDFTDGLMIFTKPNQVLFNESKVIDPDAKGWVLLFHPDLIRKSELGKNIDQYSYFSYEVHEALHLSDDEKNTLNDLIAKIRQEYSQNIDKHSQKLIISTIELLLDYCNRYYDRQFYIRTNYNQDLISKFEALLKEYYSSDKPHQLGIPSVKYCGEQMNMSPNYLSDLLKKETGKNAKDHIYYYITNKAKNKLLGTTLSVSEIAYDLGFEYPQHFSKLFKKKTGISPAQYRNAY